MLSDKQLAANRANAQLSTGPRTPEGKARSAQNATRHGLTSHRVVLSSEEAPAYEALLENLRMEHNPRTLVQEQLVQDLAWSWWKLQRAVTFQTQTLETEPDNINKVMMWERYENNARRAYHRALKALEVEAKKPAPPAMSDQGRKIKAVLDQFCPGLDLHQSNPLFANSDLGRFMREDLKKDLQALRQAQNQNEKEPETTQTAS